MQDTYHALCVLANNTTNEELKYSEILFNKKPKIIDTLLQYNDNFIFIDF